MSQKRKNIEELFTDTGAINEKEAVEALRPFVSVQRQTKDIFLRNVEKLTVEEKIIVYALTKKLLKTQGYKESDIISASEIHKKTGIKKGSIDVGFKKLRENGFLVGSGQSYELPHHKVDKIIKLLKVKHK